MNSVYSIWNYFFILFGNGHFHNVVSTLTNVAKLDVKKENNVSTLSNVAHINVDSTLVNVVNSNLEIHNVVSSLIWRCPKSRRCINRKTTLKQCWNVYWVAISPLATRLISIWVNYLEDKLITHLFLSVYVISFFCFIFAYQFKKFPYISLFC